MVLSDTFTIAHRARIISAAAQNNVPAVSGTTTFARDGGLLSYGPDRVDNWRRAAFYVDRILRGAKPGDFPVQFPTKFEMIVNLKTAKALGLTVPQSIFFRGGAFRPRARQRPRYATPSAGRPSHGGASRAHHRRVLDEESLLLKSDEVTSVL